MKKSLKDKVVLAIGAHPDDVEFGAGATMAKLSSLGAKVYIVVCTDGNRGSRHHQVDKGALVESRRQEQLLASKVLGAEEVNFLDEEDGNLKCDIHLKEKLVRVIRRLKPEMIFTHDPSWFYTIREDGLAGVNHTDHRATGEAVMDAVYPLARDLQSFPDHIEEGLEVHIVPELYFWGAKEPNFYFDVTDFVETKINSIAAHKSQIDDLETVRARVTKRLNDLGNDAKMTYAEGFIQLKFS